MKGIEDRLQRVEESLKVVEARLHGVFDALASYQEVLSYASRREKNAIRRKHYRDAKKRREEGLVPLPKQHVLKFRDERLKHKIQHWAEVGMRFGRADKPEEFLTWFVHQWNNCSYLKKPITFSGSSFRVWCTDVRFSYGSYDLMQFKRHKRTLQLLRDDAQHDDFQKRPWWDWAYAVLLPIFEAMEEMPGFADLPCRFIRCVRLILGGFGMYEVYTDLYWDPNESRENVNRMLKRIGVDLRLMLQACWVGLRVKGETWGGGLPVSPLLPDSADSVPSFARAPLNSVEHCIGYAGRACEAPTSHCLHLDQGRSPPDPMGGRIDLTRVHSLCRTQTPPILQMPPNSDPARRVNHYLTQAPSRASPMGIRVLAPVLAQGAAGADDPERATG